MFERTCLLSEDHYRSLVDLSPDIIYRLDVEGRILFISNAVRQLGYDPEELTGQFFEDIVHPDDRSKGPARFVERRVGYRSVQRLEMRLLKKNRAIQDYSLAQVTVELTARGKWDVPDSDISNPRKRFLCSQGVARDVTEHKRMEVEREKLILELKEALLRVRTLSGLLPICSSCKKIRDDEGRWHPLEDYVREHSEAEFTHTICPECARKTYPNYFK
jgi:PAS domain S-box-containing protein